MIERVITIEVEMMGFRWIRKVKTNVEFQLEIFQEEMAKMSEDLVNDILMEKRT